MKKVILLAIFTLIIGFTAFGQAKSVAPKEMTVKEYFLAIPSDYLRADAKKRAAWIDSESAGDGFLSYEVPIFEVTGDKDDKGKVFGNVQVFKKKKGGAVIGMTTNLCEEGICIGQILLLDFNAGKWSDVTSDLAPIVDNDEVIAILKKAPAYDKPLKDSVEVPLAIGFNGTNKLIEFTAGGNNGDGGVVAKMFKWNGEIFTEFEHQESPE